MSEYSFHDFMREGTHKNEKEKKCIIQSKAGTSQEDCFISTHFRPHLLCHSSSWQSHGCQGGIDVWLMQDWGTGAHRAEVGSADFSQRHLPLLRVPHKHNADILSNEPLCQSIGSIVLILELRSLNLEAIAGDLFKGGWDIKPDKKYESMISKIFGDKSIPLGDEARSLADANIMI
jgi:hypothetical protein